MSGALSREARAVRRAVRAIGRVRNMEAIARELSVGITNGAIRFAGTALSDLAEYHAKTIRRRVCAHCGLRLDLECRADAKYCDDKCRAKAHQDRITAIRRNFRRISVAATDSTSESRGVSV